MSEGRPEDINGDSPFAIAPDASVEVGTPDPSPEDMGSLASSVQEAAPLDVDAITHEQALQEDFPTPAIVPMQTSEEPVANPIEQDSAEDPNATEIEEPTTSNESIQNEGEAAIQPVEDTTTGAMDTSNATPGQDVPSGDVEQREEAFPQQLDAESNVAALTASDSNSDPNSDSNSDLTLDSDRHLATSSSSSTAMPLHSVVEDDPSIVALENESSNPQLGAQEEDAMGLGVHQNSDTVDEITQDEQPNSHGSTSDRSSDVLSGSEVVVKGEIEPIKDEVENRSIQIPQDQQRDINLTGSIEAEQPVAAHEAIKEEAVPDATDAMEDNRVPTRVAISESTTEVKDAFLPAHGFSAVSAATDAMTDGTSTTKADAAPLSVKQEEQVEVEAAPAFEGSTQVAQTVQSVTEENASQLDESIKPLTSVQSAAPSGSEVVNINIPTAVEQAKVDEMHEGEQDAVDARTEAMNSATLAQPSPTVSHSHIEERRDSTASSTHELPATEAQTSTLTVTTTVAVEATVEVRTTPVIPTTVPPAALAAAEAAGGAGCTRCPCNDNENEDGFMIQCELCDVWQHGLCIGINSENEAPSQYFCELCLPDLEVHRRRREHAANGVFYTRPAKTRRARGERSKKSTAATTGGGRGKSAKAASPAGEDEEEPTEEATARRLPADGGDSMHAGSDHPAEVEETTSTVQATAPTGTNAAAATSSLDRDLMTIDDSKLTREERSLKRYMESFLKLEERQRRAIQVQQQKSAIGTASGSSFGSGTSFSGKDLAGSNSASASSFGADSGPIEGEDPRAARLRQRERQRLLEEHQARIAQAQLLEDQPPRPPTPPPLGSPTSPHPPEWIMRSLKPRGDMYLGRKSYLLRATLAAPGPFDPVVVEPQFLSQGNWTKRLALMHEAESDAQGLPRPIPMRGSLTSPRATQDVNAQSR